LGGGAGDGGDEQADDDELTKEHRARKAARVAYVGAKHYGLGLDVDKIAAGIEEPAEFRAAGDFILANRDAPASSIPIHLALQNLGGSRSPSAVETMLWSVYRGAFLMVHDHLDGEEKAAAAAKVTPPAGGSWPGEQTLQPQQPAFSPTGFSPR